MIILQYESVCSTYNSGKHFKSFVYKQTTKIAVPKLLACQLVTTLMQLICCWVCSPACLVLADPLGCAASGQGRPEPGEPGRRAAGSGAKLCHRFLLVLVLSLLPASVPHPFCRDGDAHRGGAGMFWGCSLGNLGNR